MRWSEGTAGIHELRFGGFTSAEGNGIFAVMWNPLTGFLTGTGGTVSFSAHDDARLIVYSLYFFRRYKRDAENTG